MRIRKNKNIDWIELGGVAAEEKSAYPICRFGKLYVRKVFDKLFYKFKDIDTNTEYVVSKNTDLDFCSRNACVHLLKNEYIRTLYFDVPQW